MRATMTRLFLAALMTTCLLQIPHAVSAPVETDKEYDLHIDGVVKRVKLRLPPPVVVDPPVDPPVDPNPPVDPTPQPEDPENPLPPEQRAPTPTVELLKMGVPNLHRQATIRTVKSGMWADPTVWDLGRKPAVGESVSIESMHDVHMCTNCAVGVDVKYIAVAGGLMAQSAVFRCDTIVGTTENSMIMLEGTGDAPTVITTQVGPIDTTADPKRWSRGLVSLGHVIVTGDKKVESIQFAGWTAKGDNTITLAERPDTWFVGDSIAVPATRQRRPGVGSLSYLEGERRRITAIDLDAQTITLDRPFVYAHEGAVDHHGNRIAQAMPWAINETRSVRIVSGSLLRDERAHVMFHHTAKICGLEVENGGRSPIDPSGQKGLYCLHLHLDPMYGNVFEYCGAHFTEQVPIDLRTTVSIHGTHFSLISHCAFESSGSAIWLGEDGSETGDVCEDTHMYGMTEPFRLPNAADNSDSKRDERGTLHGGIWSQAGGCISRRNKYSCLPLCETSFPNNAVVKIPKTSAGDMVGETITIDKRKRPILPSGGHHVAACGEFCYDWNEFGRYNVNTKKIDLSMPEVYIHDCFCWHMTRFDNFYYGGNGRVVENITMYGDPTVKDSDAFSWGGSQCPTATIINATVHGYSCAVAHRASNDGTTALFNGITTSAPNPVRWDIIAHDPWGPSLSTTYQDWTYVAPTVTVPKGTYSNYRPLNKYVIEGDKNVSNRFLSQNTTTFVNFFGLNGQYYPLRQGPDYVLPKGMTGGRIAGDALAPGDTRDPAVAILTVSGKKYIELGGLTNAKAFALYGKAMNGKPAPCTTITPRVDGFICSE